MTIACGAGWGGGGGGGVVGLCVSPSPSSTIPQPAAPPYRNFVGPAYNLRECQCMLDWDKRPADTVGLCRCRGICPSFVTPVWLTEAAGQALCSLEEPTGYACYAECVNEKVTDIKWYAQPCGSGDQIPCDPIIAGSAPKVVKAAPPAAVAAPVAPPPKPVPKGKGKAPPPAPVPPPAPAKVAEKAAPEKPAGPPTKEEKLAAITAKLGYDPHTVWDLRGLQCEEKDGKPQCFYEDAQGRELCPSFVTPEWLSAPPHQWLCTPDMADTYYCTVGCQEGNDDVRWGAHEMSWCYQPQNKGSCPPKPPVFPKEGFKLAPWSEVPEPLSKCAAAAAAGGVAATNALEDLSVGMLTHEPRSMKDSLGTYEEMGLFDVVPEFMIYANKRTPEIDAAIAPFAAKHKNIRVMGDADNHGILRAMTFLTGNASKPYFLFLERDFQLVEPATCVVEQLLGGLELLKSKAAVLVRYRHRKRAGRPNWAEKMYRGHEDDVFKSHQPNLFCNHYYWVPEPEKRWPDKMPICSPPGQEPVFHCSDSFYCNWTNNPQLWEVKWWNEEHVARFNKPSRNDPCVLGLGGGVVLLARTTPCRTPVSPISPHPTPSWYDLESYMNWAPDSWNTRKFTVAQGNGLFKVRLGDWALSARETAWTAVAAPTTRRPDASPPLTPHPSPQHVDRGNFGIS